MCLDKAPRGCSWLHLCWAAPSSIPSPTMASMGVGPAMVGEDLGTIPMFLQAWVGPGSPSACDHRGSSASSLIKWEFPQQGTVCGCGRVKAEGINRP